MPLIDSGVIQILFQGEWRTSDLSRRRAPHLTCETRDSGMTREATTTTLSTICATTVCFSLSRSTGKERDTESGNDYFGARYYASSMGRFMSPDWAKNVQAVPFADFTHPQTLNLYQYMRNNPLGGSDPDGHSPDIGWLVSVVSTKVSTYLAQHPDVANAISKMGDTAGIKASLGFGATGSVPGTGKALKGEASATAYISLSPDKGLGEGLQGTLGAKVGPVGGEGSLDVPVVKGGELVNPLSNASVSGSGTLTGESEATHSSGAGSVNGDDTSIGGNYGEGVVGGVEISAGTDSLIDVGKEMVNGLINDTKQLVNDVKTAATCTGSSCSTPH
jgi:RHS repeat-associated protein